jgi:hypothetical protein
MVIMKNAVFWDVTLCGCCKNRRLEEHKTRIGELGTLAVTNVSTTTSSTSISSQHVSVASYCYRS